MGMPAQNMRWTAEMVRALPDDGKRYEVLDGNLFVSPAPSRLHQRAVKELLIILHEYCQEHSLGEALDSPADIEFADDRVMQPDVFVVPDPGQSWRDVTRLSLAAEVISPSTARADRQDKKHIYQTECVPEYWIVDLDARIIERWRPDDSRPEILSEQLVWQPGSAYQALTIDLPAYFHRVFKSAAS
jgi:Uma2 family endonuclease